MDSKEIFDQVNYISTLFEAFMSDQTMVLTGKQWNNLRKLDEAIAEALEMGRNARR